ncbi:MAG: DMT family transporter [Beijerinckiaceae bacterium]|nr:DMT family transporter [Beijerinckiaceae bacterium]
MFLLVLAPALFVVIWSTGWIVAKYAAPFADPLTFLAIRFALAAAVIALLAWATGAPWPPDRRTRIHAAISGVLLHAIYLGGVWWAISQGLPAGVSALIAAVQPLLTAALARTMGEKLLPINLAGIVIGFAGVLGVIAPKLGGVSVAGLSGLGLAVAINIGSMVAVTAGTYYQKHFVASGDLRTTTVLQYIGACLAILPFAILLEPMRFEMRLETWAAMAWSVIVLSIGAIGLMLLMIRRGAVSRVAALIYLIPPTAALQAYAMFGEMLTPMQGVFMAVAAFGVFLATRR